MVNDLYAHLEAAINLTCPVVPQSQICKGNPWFTAALKDKRKHMFKLYDKWKAVKTKYNENAYKAVEKDYKKHCLQVKLNFRKDYKEKLSSESDMADLMKQLMRKSAPQVGTIKLDNGLYTLPGVETLKAMADAHFQGHDPEHVIQTPILSLGSNDIAQMFDGIITADRLKLAFEGFKNKKSPGHKISFKTTREQHTSELAQLPSCFYT
jgi:hypothetical protein